MSGRERNLPLTDEFKEEVERMGGLGVLYGLYRADPWADKDEKTGIVPELSAKAYNMVQHYVMEHSRLGIPMMMSSECPPWPSGTRRRSASGQPGCRSNV